MAHPRICSVCGEEHYEGYYLGGDYACSDECRNEFYKKHLNAKDDEEAAELYAQDNDSDNNEYFWTEWF